MELRTKIEQSLQKFTDSELQKASLNLLNTLGYQSEKTLDLGGAPETFLDQFVTSPGLSFNKDKALFDDWNEIHLLFQLTDEELSKESSLFETNSIDTTVWKSYLFFAIELKGEDYARGKLTAVVRQINRLFQTPVMVLIKHGDFLSVAVINRRQHKLQADKDVLGKVTIIRDISLTSPHRGHLDILDSFALPSLLTKTLIHDFDTLHAAWEEIFNVELLNKRFYKELANWYFWALPEIKFPDDLKPKGLSSDQETTYYEKLRSTGLIRLLTRLIFCWFLKEKDLIPKLLFDETKLPDILKNLDDNESTFHRAIRKSVV